MTEVALKKRIERKELKRLKELATLTENISDARIIRKGITSEQRKEILEKSKASTRDLNMSFKDPQSSLPELENTIFFYSI